MKRKGFWWTVIIAAYWLRYTLLHKKLQFKPIKYEGPYEALRVIRHEQELLRRYGAVHPLKLSP